MNESTSIGHCISKTSESGAYRFTRLLELSKYVQKWADILDVGYWDVNNLPISDDDSLTIEERIDLSVKENLNHVFKQTDVMARILGRK